MMDVFDSSIALLPLTRSAADPLKVSTSSLVIDHVFDNASAVVDTAGISPFAFETRKMAPLLFDSSPQKSFSAAN